MWRRRLFDSVDSLSHLSYFFGESQLYLSLDDRTGGGENQLYFLIMQKINFIETWYTVIFYVLILPPVPNYPTLCMAFDQILEKYFSFLVLEDFPNGLL